MGIIYRVKEDPNPVLGGYVKSIWYSSGQHEHEKNIKLLPMPYIDLVIIKQGALSVYRNHKEISVNDIFVQGLERYSIDIVQNEKVETFGISFYPYGLYPFINKPMYEMIDSLKESYSLFADYFKDIISVVKQGSGIENIWCGIERILKKRFKADRKYRDSVEYIRNFSLTSDLSIEDFCLQEGINKRKLERIFRRYVGVPPMQLKVLIEFSKISNFIIYEKPDNFKGGEYLDSYYDQPYFIKRFKQATGYTPNEFLKNDPSLKSRLNNK